MSAPPTSPDSDAIARAGDALRAGDLVILPTETVYGLAGDATNAAAVARIFAAKDRPRINPLIIHVADADAAFALIAETPGLRALADAFWPGPLTLIGDRRPEARIADLAAAGLATLAVRVPAHPVARAVITAAGRPLAAPSANRSGRITATDAAAAAEELGHAAMTLDGGASALGLESTVVDARGAPALLRPGALTRAAIAAVCGPLSRPAPAGAPASPGQLLRHYAPRRPLRLDAGAPEGEDEGLLSFGPVDPAGYARCVALSPTGDLAQAAAGLFAGLRALDAPPVRRIAVSPIPDRGLGEAINDRLRRAAAAVER